MRIKNCEICGQEIVNGGKAKHCSEKCTEKGRRRYNKWYYENKVRDSSSTNCIICGSTFYPRGNQKMCSDKCVEQRKLQYRDKHNPPKKIVMNCRWCGHKFTSIGGSHFCTDKCRGEHLKDYNRKYYRAVVKKRRASQEE